MMVRANLGLILCVKTYLPGKFSFKLYNFYVIALIQIIQHNVSLKSFNTFGIDVVIKAIGFSLGSAYIVGGYERKMLDYGRSLILLQ